MSDGLRTVGWGPFRWPGERKRMERAQRHAEEMMRATAHLRRPRRPVDERWRVASFVLARAEEAADPKLTAEVDTCFDKIDVTTDPTRRQYVLGDIADEAKLRELALRWASHPDYPQPRHG